MYKRYLYLFFFLSFIFSYQSSARSYSNVDAQPITICSSAPITIQGDIETPAPSSYLWQVLQGGSWVNAPGIINLADYTASKLVNNTTANMVFSIRRQIVTAGVTDYDSFYDVTVLPSAPVTGNQITAPAISSFCITGSATAITGNVATGGNGTVVYQWQQSIDNVNFANIAGATASSYTPPTLNVTTYYRRLASAGSCVAASTSNVVSIVIIQTAGGNTITTPAISNFCASSNPSIIAGSTATGGDGTYTYQWQSSSTSSNFTDIPGANTKDYNPSVITNTTYFRRYVSSGACSTPVYSNIVLISILPALGNNTITAPNVASFCVGGDAATINGTTPTGGNGTYAYQWQQSTDNSTFTDIPGATSINYDPSFISVSTYYRRNIISGQCTTPVSSNAILINILPVPAVPVPTQASVPICSGTAATLSVSNPQAGLVYNWYDSATKTTLLYTGITYTTALLTANTTFYIESSNGICSSLSLAPVQAVIIVPVPITNNSITLPAINNFCAPSDPDVITGSNPGGGTGTYLYQWQSSTDNVTFTDIPGATGINYDPALISTTTYYRRSVISGPCTTPVFGNTVAIAILPALANNAITAPAVTSFCLGGNAATINGTTPTGGNGTYGYQWQQSTDNSTFTDIPGATSINYDPPFITVSTYYRRNIMSGQCTTPVSSNAILISILPVPTSPVPLQSSVTICPGTTATLSVNNPQNGLVYNWYDSATKTTLLFTGTTYTTLPLTANTTYYIESSNGVCPGSPLSTVQVLINVAAIISNNTITLPAVNSFCAPADPDIITGSTPSGGLGGYVYQWQSSTDNVIFTDISGATSISYDPALISTTTYFRRGVSSGICSVPFYSNSVAIAILPAIANNSITAPIITTFCVGGDAAVITGSTPTGGNGTYTYQWQQSTDNSTFTDIPGATDIDYDPPAIGVSTYYRRNIISGQCTTPVSSNAILINILPVPAVPVPTQASVPICSGTAATLSVSNPQAGLVYNWYDSETKTTLLFTGTTYTTPLLTANTTFYIESSNGICSSLSLAPVQAVIIVPVSITNNSITLPAINNFCAPSDPDVITGSNPGGGTGTYLYQWQSSTDNVTFTDIPGATDINYDPALTSTTTYYRRSVISGPCTTSAYGNTVAIAILPAITNNTITAPAVTSFCLGGDASDIAGNIPTGGNGNYIYQWQQSTDNSTFTDIAGATSSDFDPSFISVTTYYRRTVIAGQCTTPVLSNVISINIVPVPDTPVPVQAVVNICPGSSASLAVNSPQAGFTYNWYDSAAKTTLLYTGIAYLTPPQTAAATYYIESSNGSCTSSALGVVQVALTAPPDAPLLVNSTINICVNSATTITVLNPQGGFTYRWYASADGTNVIFSGSTFTSPLLSANTNYYVEAVNQSGCTSTSKSIVNIMVSPLPVVTTQNATNCAGSPVTLLATANITNATFNWYNSATGGTPVYTGSAFTIPTVTGNISYYVEAVNQVTGCVSATRQIATATIAQPLPAPVVTFTGTTYNSVSFSWNAVPNATAYQVSTDNGATYHDPSSGSNGLTDVESNLKQNQAVTILVRAVGAVVCQLSANSTPVTGVAQGQGDEIYVANAFTPNGDGVNDIAYVHSEGIKSFDFYVYDQWGEMIFTTSSQTTGWDGTYKGKREPVGVYIYYVKATMNNGHQLTKKGTITLLR